MGGSFSWLPAHRPPPFKALMGAFPMPWPGLALGLDLHLPHLPVPAPGAAPSALTLLGVRSHFLHELNEVFQELGVVVGGIQVLAILSGGRGGARGVGLGGWTGQRVEASQQVFQVICRSARPPGGVGRCVLTGCSRSGPGGLPGLRGGQS